jgi:hypothetical protein
VAIPNPAKCEVHSVIRFLDMKGEAPAEIHCRFVSVVGDFMNRQNVTKCCHEFNAGRTGVHADRCVTFIELHEVC